jgi:cell wall-associated NlpC family hydrolase
VLQTGDLLFFDLDKTADGRTDHVAIYLGRDESGGHRFVSSRVRADGPTLGDLGGTSLLDDGGYYARSFRSAKRL